MKVLVSPGESCIRRAVFGPAELRCKVRFCTCGGGLCTRQIELPDTTSLEWNRDRCEGDARSENRVSAAPDSTTRLRNVRESTR